MDLINNLIFTSLNAVDGFGPLVPRFFALAPPILAAQPINRGGNFFSYNLDVIQEFCSVDDPELIDDAFEKHWHDITLRERYENAAGAVFSRFVNIVGARVPPYHLIYAYLVENTRAAQIFEKVVYLYQHDEKLRKTNQQNRLAFQWIQNTEDLFFKNTGHFSRSITSKVRRSDDAARRNAYYRLFGMDLAFGDLYSDGQTNYYKAEFNNKPFIVLFEKFLMEIWQAYTNARNQVGANTTDMFSIVDCAQKLQEMLMSRRTTEANFANYRYFNLSREEYYSVVMMSWFYEVLSYDSPIVEFLRCNGNTPGERLINIGKRVELPAHSKSEGLLDIAPPMNTLLRRIELGDFNLDNEPLVRRIIESQTPAIAPPSTLAERQALTDLLSIINNWEKATGHRIKNPESNIRGAVAIASPKTNGKVVQTSLS